MKQIFIFSFAIVFALSALLGAQKKRGVSFSFVTSFDFNGYPACSLTRTRICVEAVRFYDADSAQSLVETSTAGMEGDRVIIGTVQPDFIPRRVYAASVYRDTAGFLREGPAGPISEFIR
jgi:hypothetical protein